MNIKCNTFGEYLKSIRYEKRMTLRDIQEKTRISNAYICQVENGKRKIASLRVIVKLSDALGISPYYLIDKAIEQLKKG